MSFLKRIWLLFDILHKIILQEPNIQMFLNICLLEEFFNKFVCWVWDEWNLMKKFYGFIFSIIPSFFVSFFEFVMKLWILIFIEGYFFTLFNQPRSTPKLVTSIFPFFFVLKNESCLESLIKQFSDFFLFGSFRFYDFSFSCNKLKWPQFQKIVFFKFK